MSRAALYIRVSSADQVHGYSLDVQERACREWCAREGVDVAGVYREEGESAKTADRPELQRMLVDVARRGAGFAFVVVYDLSRLTRDTFDQLAIERHLEQHGVRLRAATQNLEDSEEGRFVRTVLAATNTLENGLRRRKVLAGMREAIARGRWVWEAPVGYRWVRSADGREKWIEPDPDVAPHLRWAFERAATGIFSKPEIQAELAARGFDIPRATLYRILRNPIYAGRIVSRRWGLDVAGGHEPLVDLVTFRAANHAVTKRRSYAVGATDAFPFRALTRCAGCGRGLAGYFARGKAGKRYPFYRCQACRANVPARRVEERFARLLDGLAVAPRMVDALELVLRDTVAQRAAGRRDRAAAAGRRLAAERQKLQRLTEAFLYREALPETEYRVMRAELERTVCALEEEAAGELRPEVRFEHAWAIARDLLQLPLLAWDRLSPAARPAWLRGVFPAGLEWDPAGEFRTPTKCLLYMPFGPIPGPKVQGGTPDEADLEQLAGWLVAFGQLGTALGVPQCSDSSASQPLPS